MNTNSTNKPAKLESNFNTQLTADYERILVMIEIYSKTRVVITIHSSFVILIVLCWSATISVALIYF